MGIKYIKKMDSEIRENLEKFLTCGRFDAIEASVLKSGFSKRMLYPTEDFHLNEAQFRVIKSLLAPGEDLLILQMGFEEGLFSFRNNLYVCDCDLSYAAYDEIWIDTISVVAPSSWAWIVLIDEALEGGLGIFISDPELINRFDRLYGNTVSDMVSFVASFIRRMDAPSYPIKYMMEVLTLCKDPDKE